MVKLMIMKSTKIALVGTLIAISCICLNELNAKGGGRGGGARAGGAGRAGGKKAGGAKKHAKELGKQAVEGAVTGGDDDIFQAPSATKKKPSLVSQDPVVQQRGKEFRGALTNPEWGSKVSDAATALLECATSQYAVSLAKDRKWTNGERLNKFKDLQSQAETDCSESQKAEEEFIKEQVDKKKKKLAQ